MNQRTPCSLSIATSEVLDLRCEPVVVLPRIELTKQAAKGVGNEQSCGNLQRGHLEGRAGR